MIRDYVPPSLILFVLLGGCATMGQGETEPRIITIETVVPVASPCVPANIGAPPAYPDSDEALRRASGPDERYQLVIAGRVLKDARLAELEPVVAACPKATR